MTFKNNCDAYIETIKSIIMEKEQILEPTVETVNVEFSYTGHTEPCGQFIGHPSDPCERCGFSYFRHTG